MIRHTVIFRLVHVTGSEGEKSFVDAARKLRAIPGIKNFEVLAQVSSKNDYAFGLSMEFSDQTAYQVYNDHPDHVAFVRNHWIPEVSAFMEIDYVPLP